MTTQGDDESGSLCYKQEFFARLKTDKAPVSKGKIGAWLQTHW